MSGVRFNPPANYTNHFRDMDRPEYNEADLDWLLAEYEDNGDPVHMELRKLLYGLRDFFDASTLAEPFRAMRNAEKDQTRCIPTLNAIGIAIKRTKDLETNKQLSPGARDIYRSAVGFVSKSVAIRLNELEDQKDILYGVYEHKDNVLKQLIPPVSLRVLAERQKP